MAKQDKKILRNESSKDGGRWVGTNYHGERYTGWQPIPDWQMDKALPPELQAALDKRSRELDDLGDWIKKQRGR